MNRYFVILFGSIILFSCQKGNKSKNNSNLIKENANTKNELAKDTISSIANNSSNRIIAERIDGPANIRDKPNGEILFVLEDNVLVEVGPIKDDWYPIIARMDINKGESFSDINKGKEIIIDGEKSGKVLDPKAVEGIMKGRDFTIAELYGYTHKQNIKSYTIIENVLVEYLKKNGRDISNWYEFIEMFAMEEDAVGYNKYRTYYNYESIVEDPSPGFRIVLLFESDKLIGFIHSRGLNLDKMDVHKLKWSCQISFFQDHLEADQKKFVDYMNEWIQGVD